MTHQNREALEVLDKIEEGLKRWQISGFKADFETIRTALTRSEWKTMESAPMEHGIRMIFLVKGKHAFGAWFNNKSYPKLSRWRMEDKAEFEYGDQPTHWMPLPQPPKEK